MKPSISALIIRKHVTEGLEMAKKYGFEEEILDGIATHHGTRVISYFYKKLRNKPPRASGLSGRLHVPRAKASRRGVSDSDDR